MFPDPRAWIVVFPLVPSKKSTEHVSPYIDTSESHRVCGAIWFNLQGCFYCSLDVLHGSFLFWFYLKLAFFHVIQVQVEQYAWVWNVLSLEIKEVYQMLCLIVVGDARWSHLSFTLMGNPQVYSWSLDTEKPSWNGRSLKFIGFYLPSSLEIYLANTSSIAVTSCLHCSVSVMPSM